MEINLKSFYSWYTHDEVIEVSEEVAAELFADKRYEQAHARRQYRNKAHYSLDAEDGIEESALVCYDNSPERIFAMMERHCGLCWALNSLPESQGKRIEAHFLLGMTMSEIAQKQGVSKAAVSMSIEAGLKAMKKYLKNI